MKTTIVRPQLTCTCKPKILTPSTVIKDGKRIVAIPYEDILWLRFSEKYLSVVTKKETVLYERSLVGFLKETSGEFVRISRDTAVLIRNIEKIVTQDQVGSLHTINGDVLHISRRQLPVLLKTLKGMK